MITLNLSSHEMVFLRLALTSRIYELRRDINVSESNGVARLDLYDELDILSKIKVKCIF